MWLKKISEKSDISNVPPKIDKTDNHNNPAFFRGIPDIHEDHGAAIRTRNKQTDERKQRDRHLQKARQTAGIRKIELMAHVKSKKTIGNSFWEDSPRSENVKHTRHNDRGDRQ